MNSNDNDISVGNDNNKPNNYLDNYEEEMNEHTNYLKSRKESLNSSHLTKRKSSLTPPPPIDCELNDNDIDIDIQNCENATLINKNNNNNESNNNSENKCSSPISMQNNECKTPINSSPEMMLNNDDNGFNRTQNIIPKKIKKKRAGM